MRNWFDKDHAQTNFRLGLSRQDEWYAYLDIKPKARKTQDWSWAACQRCRAVFMNQGTHDIPKDMPAQLWWQNESGANTQTFDILRWKVDPADGPKAEDFTRPEDRPGWKVTDWRGWPYCLEGHEPRKVHKKE